MTAAMVYGDLSAASICDDLMTQKVASEIMPTSFTDRLLSLAQTQPKFDGVGKRKTIDKYCGVINGVPRLFCPKPWERTRPDLPFVMLTTYDIVTGSPKIHRNWDDDNDELLSDVVDTTQSGYSRAVDGAVFANNPADCAYAEAIKIYGKDADIRVLSIGTGEHINPPSVSDDNDIGGIQWITQNNLISIIYDAPQAVVDMRMKTFAEALDHTYVRVNGPLENMAMDDVSAWNINMLKTQGQYWWKKNRAKVLHSMSFNEPAFREGKEPVGPNCTDIGNDYKPYFTTKGTPPWNKGKGTVLPFTPVEKEPEPVRRSLLENLLSWLF
jgi:hypothetical protein